MFQHYKNWFLAKNDEKGYTPFKFFALIGHETTYISSTYASNGSHHFSLKISKYNNIMSSSDLTKDCKILIFKVVNYQRNLQNLTLLRSANFRWKIFFSNYSDLPNNRAANLIIFRGKKYLHNLIRTYMFINFWDFSFKTWFSPT